MSARIIDLAYFFLVLTTLWYLSNATERLISAYEGNHVEIVSFKELCEKVDGNYGEAGTTFYCKVSEK